MMSLLPLTGSDGKYLREKNTSSVIDSFDVHLKQPIRLMFL
jgi:hypothetical protein